MRCLVFSVLVVLAIGLFAVTQAFADHDSDEQWGTLYVEEPVLELPLNSEYKKIKIFGTVEDPRSATWVYFTITEPDGKTSQVKVVATTNGDYENYIQVWTSSNFQKYTLNSLIISSIVVIGILFTSIPAAYAFARIDFPLKNIIFYLNQTF